MKNSPEKPFEDVTKSEVREQALDTYLESIAAQTIDLEAECFGRQHGFLLDDSPFVTAVTSRRAGKTTACAFDLLHTASSHPGVICIYITLARINASRIIWPMLKEYNLKYNLKGTVNETTLSIKLTNGSTIYCSGAKDSRAVDKFLGMPIKLAYIDEAQSFSNYLDDLINRVLAPSLLDHAGTLKIIGTPGPVPVGVFWDLCQSPQWSHHSWTFFDNPWIKEKSGKTHDELLQREITRKGVSVDDPVIQREFFGRWVYDSESLVFKYEESINEYQDIPAEANNYVLGVDIGYDDADALAVLAFGDKKKETYLVEEIVAPKQGITELVGQIELLTGKYPIYKIVMDFGGLGKKIAEEIIRRYKIPVVAAEKSRKFENIELFNDAMRTGMFRAKKSSRFAQDAMLVEWDFDHSSPERKVVSDRYHSDICDAVLYAWRESFSFTSEPDKFQPKPYTPAWFQQEKEKMEENAEEFFRRQEDQLKMPW